VGDIGQIECLQGVFKVEDTQKINDAILHYGYMEKGQLTPNEEVTALIDTSRRSLIAHNHSATHLLHAALRQLFGQDVEQQGSLVDEHKLRFDFNYDSALSFDEIRAIESLVNERIRQNDEAETILTTVEHARQLGALGLFEHKYGETVRVLRLGDFSIELCGGTHVKRTGDIGYFKITDETGVASGIRRLTAVTGAQAEKYMAGYEKLVNDIAVTLKTSSNTVLARIESLIASNRHYQKEVESLKYKLARNQNNPTQAGIAGEKIGQSLVMLKPCQKSI
jgi:alanyl-tRNA synthetase